jgi:cyclopropane-fatty-acyl-phospholipid synthase
MQSEQVYDRYMRHLTGCASIFPGGYIDVNQLTPQN